MLRISDAKELLDFHQAFKIDLLPSLRSQGIDWRTVASQYQGIIIAPYLRSMPMRLNIEMLWYSSWDCASGCIWDADAVARIERLTEFRKPRISLAAS